MIKDSQHFGAYPNPYMAREIPTCRVCGAWNRSLSATEYRRVSGAPPSEDWKLIDAVTLRACRSPSALCSADLASPLGRTTKDTVPLEAAVESTVSVPVPKISSRDGTLHGPAREPRGILMCLQPGPRSLHRGR